jgi:hypothetical protein
VSRSWIYELSLATCATGRSSTTTAEITGRAFEDMNERVAAVRDHPRHLSGMP